MSLGSLARSSLIPPEDKKTILETFLKLPYKILWKYEDDSLGELPKNIMIGSWMPQQDILGQLYWWKIRYFNSIILRNDFLDQKWFILFSSQEREGVYYPLRSVGSTRGDVPRHSGNRHADSVRPKEERRADAQQRTRPDCKLERTYGGKT